MANTLQNHPHSDSVSAPGETLLEALEVRNMSQSELAKRMMRPVKTINEIVQGKTAITPETALQLEQVLSVPARFWLRREQRYREHLARLAAKEELQKWQSWLQEIPIKEMMKRGWIPEVQDKSQQVFEALKFFSVASPDAWRAIWENEEIAYRQSTKRTSSDGAITAWLRQGELEAQAVDCALYNEQAFREALVQIRALTAQPIEDTQQELVRLCAAAGVAVVFVQDLPKTGICGATRWVTATKALLQLSLRYKTDDQLWFTLFHEAGHILLHGKRKIFLELEQKTQQEQEADAFAANVLINNEQWQQFTTQNTYRSKVGIEAFASSIGIAPGIVVGRLQHEKRIPFTDCNQLKRRLDWHKEEASDE